jgi:hypothetical protein
VNPRATIALFVFTVLLLGALVYLRQTVSPSREAASEKRYALSFDPAEIDEIDIIRGKETVSLRRENGGWRLTAPVADRADPGAVDRLLLAARFLEVRDREKARDPSAMPESGLATPRARLDLRGTGEDRLDVGGPTALPEEIFARVAGRPYVLRVAETVLEPLTAPVASYRDARLTDLLPEGIEKFTVRRADGEMTVRLERGRWIVEKPVRAPADPRAVHDFLGRLLGLRVTSFAPAPQATAETLPGQTAQLALTPRGGGEEMAVEIVRETGDGNFIARHTPRDGRFGVDAAGGALLFDISPEALRDRSLGYVDPDTIDRMVIEGDGRRDVIRRQGDGWVAGEDARPVETARVNRLIESFNAARIASFAPAAATEETGLDQPDVRLRFYAWLSENTAEEPAGGHVLAGAAFGRTTADGNLFARVEGTGETVIVAPDLAGEIAALAGWPRPAPAPEATPAD